MCKGLQTASASSIWPYCGHPSVYILRVLRAGTKVTSGRFWSWLLLWRNFCRCLSSWRFFFSCLCCSFLCLLDIWEWGKYFGTIIWFELCFPVNPKINRWFDLPWVFVRSCPPVAVGAHCSQLLLLCRLCRILRRTDPDMTDLGRSQQAILHWWSLRSAETSSPHHLMEKKTVNMWSLM